MEILTQLTPAETYLIIEGKSVTFKNLMKYTLMDLFLKKVLVVQKKKEDEEETHYVVAGPHFKNYQPKKHEKIFLTGYSASGGLAIEIGQLIKMARQNAVSKNKLIFQRLFKNQEIAKSYKRGFFDRLFGSLPVTPEGIEMRRKVSVALAKAEHELPKIVK